MTETKEDFWGCVLSKDSKECTWNAGDEAEDDISHKLQITQACLGPKAKENERNLVQVTTENDAGDNISFCIVSLRLNKMEQCALDLGLTAKSSFKLLEGHGPVHLTGCHLQALAFDSMDSDDSDPDTSMDNSLTLQKDSQKKSKANKAVLAEEDSDDDEDDDDSDVPQLTKGLLDDEASEDDDDDEDFSEDDEEEDSEDDDDDDEEEEEESEEEDEQPPVKKKKLPNGQAVAKKEKNPTTPAKAVNGKVSPKKIKEEKTPGGGKKGKSPKTPTTGPKDIEDLKKSLTKSPNLPKTLDKFKNFMRSTHRVTDEKDVKGVWEWLQKSKK